MTFVLQPLVQCTMVYIDYFISRIDCVGIYLEQMNINARCTTTIIFRECNNVISVLFTITVYCKLFEVEKFRCFRGLIGDRETFPAKHFRSWNVTVEHYRKKIGPSMRYTAGYFKLLCY